MAKKLLSIVLALFLALIVLPVGVNAEETEELATEESVEEVIVQEDQPFEKVDIVRSQEEDSDDERSSEGEAYAVLTDEGELIFFRSYETYTNKSSGTFTDVIGNEYSGTVYSEIERLNASHNSEMPWYENRSSIISSRVADHQKIIPVSTSYWFERCSSMTSLDLSGFDTSNVTNMKFMFQDCYGLSNLDVRMLDTRNVTNMYGMFDGCSSLTTLDISGFDTSCVTNMQQMFADVGVAELDVSNLDTSEVTNMSYMFSSCDNLTNLDLSSFDTCNVTHMSGMFRWSLNLENINLQGINTKKVTHFDRMFADCEKLKAISFEEFDTSSANDMAAMFFGCKSFTSLDLSMFRTEKVTDMASMFCNCTNLVSLDICGFDTSSVTNMKAMFAWDERLRNIYVSEKWNTDNVTSSDGMFDYCYSLPNWNGIIKTKIMAHYGEGGYLTYKPYSDDNPTDPTNISIELKDMDYVVKLGERVQILGIYKGNQIDNFEVEFSDPDAFEEIDKGVIPGAEDNEHGLLITLKALKVGVFDVTVKNGDLLATVQVSVNEEGEDPPLPIPIDWSEEDQWPFYNAASDSIYLGFVRNDSDGYYISQDDYDRLTSNLSVLDGIAVTKFNKQYMLNINGEIINHRDWGGSCEGIASTANMIKQSFYTTDDIGKGGKKVSEIGSTKDIQSFINFFYVQWGLAVRQNDKRDYLRKSQFDQIRQIENLIFKGKPVNISYYAYDYKRTGNAQYEEIKEEDPETGELVHKSWAHTVLAYRVESGDYTVYLYKTDDDPGVEYQFDKRIIVYDSRSPGDEGTYLYYDSDYRKWCIPYENMLSISSYENVNAYNNGFLQSAAADYELLNAVDYRTGELSNAAKKAEIDSPRLFKDTFGEYDITYDSGSATVDGAKSNSEDVKIAIISDGISDQSAEIVFLPDTQDINVESSENTINLGIANNGVLFNVESDSTGSAFIDDWNSINVNLDENSNTQLSIISNDPIMDWNIFTIDEPDGEQIFVEITEDGLKIAGDSLEDVVVTAENNEGSKEIELSTDEDSVVIQEENGELVIVEESFEINPASVTILYNQTTQLIANQDNLIWTSSNEEIATIDQNGKVTGKKVGKATITATTVNGLTATCEVRVLFTDVANGGKYYFNPVYWAVDKAITTGTSPSTFEPNAYCTREQFVTFLWRLRGEPEPKTTSNFADVAKDKWYYKAITWAFENGITTGVNSTNFGVGQACTREQCVTFLFRAAGSPGGGAWNPFTDVKSDAYYYSPVLWAAGNNITTGLNDGTGRFGVGQKCTRGMLVTFLYRFAEYEEEYQ